MHRSAIHKESVNLQANQIVCNEEITSSARKISSHHNRWHGHCHARLYEFLIRKYPYLQHST